MRWSTTEYGQYLQREAEALERRRKRADSAGGAPPRAVVEQVVCNESVATATREAPNTGRFRVRITGYRRRLLDPDNLCAKYFVDCLRYAGLIPNDREQDITLEVGQIKVAKKENERTEILITPHP